MARSTISTANISAFKRKFDHGDADRDAGDMMVMKLFHGTSWETATNILRNGFIESEDGCLGPGVYIARREKARKFATNRHHHGGREGGLVTVLVSVRRPKYVRQDDGAWQVQGYDACRAEETTASTNMEWCIASRNQLEVVAVEEVGIDESAMQPGELLSSPPVADVAFGMAYLGRRDILGASIASQDLLDVYRRPEYPGETTGKVIRRGQSVTCRPPPGGGITQFVKRSHETTNHPIRFYRLADGSGWIHDFNGEFPEQRTLHVHFLRTVHDLFRIVGRCCLF